MVLLSAFYAKDYGTVILELVMLLCQRTDRMQRELEHKLGYISGLLKLKKNEKLLLFCD